MKFLLQALLCVGLMVSTVYGRAAVDIKATKKTASKHKGSQQQLPRGQTQSTEDSVYYVLEIKNNSSTAAGAVDLQWIVLLEGAGGRISPATSGTEQLTLSFGRTETVETGTITLRGREWSGRHRSGKVEDEIAGYGVRVLNQQGDVIATKYHPSSIESKVDWDVLSSKKDNRPGKREPLQRPKKHRRRL